MAAERQSVRDWLRQSNRRIYSEHEELLTTQLGAVWVSDLIGLTEKCLASLPLLHRESLMEAVSEHVAPVANSEVAYEPWRFTDGRLPVGEWLRYYALDQYAGVLEEMGLTDSDAAKMFARSKICRKCASGLGMRPLELVRLYRAARMLRHANGEAVEKFEPLLADAALEHVPLRLADSAPSPSVSGSSLGSGVRDGATAWPGAPLVGDYGAVHQSHFTGLGPLGGHGGAAHPPRIPAAGGQRSFPVGTPALQANQSGHSENTQPSGSSSSFGSNPKVFSEHGISGSEGHAPLAAGGAGGPMFGDPDPFKGVEIDMKRLLIGESIGEGSFGKVFKCEYNGTELAVKKIPMRNLNPLALQELDALKKIYNHPHVLGLVGAGADESHLLLLTPYMREGNLRDYLYSKLQQAKRRGRVPTGSIVAPLEIVRMAMHTCLGMVHLHSKRVCHRDLACRNLLLDEKHKVLVADFGLSRSAAAKDGDLIGKSSSTVGPLRWMSPESMNLGSWSERSDVFMFGQTLVEMLTCQVPWHGLSPVAASRNTLEGKKIPLDGCEPRLIDVYDKCTEWEPKKRPTFMELLGMLDEIQRELNDAERSRRSSMHSEHSDVADGFGSSPSGGLGELGAAGAPSGRLGSASAAGAAVAAELARPTSPASGVRAGESSTESAVQDASADEHRHSPTTIPQIGPVDEEILQEHLEGKFDAGDSSPVGPIRVGTKVRVRKDVLNPTHYWGAINHDSVGSVRSTQLRLGDCIVDFPEQPGWYGQMQELEELQLSVGDRVSVPAAKVGFEGAAPVIGDVLSVRETGECVVSFEGQPNWNGNVREVHYEPTLKGGAGGAAVPTSTESAEERSSPSGERSSPSGEVKVGDRVYVYPDAAKLKARTSANFVWVDAMSASLKQRGTVRRVSNGLARVEFDSGAGWSFPVDALRVTVENGDRVRIATDARSVDSVGLDGFVWVPAMAEYLGKEACVVKVENGMAKVVFADSATWNFPLSLLSRLSKLPEAADGVRELEGLRIGERVRLPKEREKELVFGIMASLSLGDPDHVVAAHLGEVGTISGFEIVESLAVAVVHFSDGTEARLPTSTLQSIGDVGPPDEARSSLEAPVPESRRELAAGALGEAKSEDSGAVSDRRRSPATAERAPARARSHPTSSSSEAREGPADVFCATFPKELRYAAACIRFGDDEDWNLMNRILVDWEGNGFHLGPAVQRLRDTKGEIDLASAQVGCTDLDAELVARLHRLLPSANYDDIGELNAGRRAIAAPGNNSRFWDIALGIAQECDPEQESSWESTAAPHVQFFTEMRYSLVEPVNAMRIGLRTPAQVLPEGSYDPGTRVLVQHIMGILVAVENALPLLGAVQDVGMTEPPELSRAVLTFLDRRCKAIVDNKGDNTIRVVWSGDPEARDTIFSCGGGRGTACLRALGFEDNVLPRSSLPEAAAGGGGAPVSPSDAGANRALQAVIEDVKPEDTPEDHVGDASEQGIDVPRVHRKHRIARTPESVAAEAAADLCMQCGKSKGANEYWCPHCIIYFCGDCVEAHIAEDESVPCFVLPNKNWPQLRRLRAYVDIE